MAGLGRKVFSAGDILTAADVDGYLMDQTVMKFASSTARSSVIGTAVSAGMVSYRTDGSVVEFYNGSAWTALGTGTGDVTTSGTQTLTNKTLTAPTVTSPIFNGAAAEAYVQTGTGFAGYTFYAGTNGAIQQIVAASTANGAVNISWASGTTLNAQLANAQSITVTLIVYNTGTAYYPTSIQIDGTTSGVTTRWSGGTAPTAGNSNSLDVYTFNVLKTASATFQVLASQTKFA